jgi:PTH1 family peptidyl-tRNA hydrolase
MKLIIGLGNPGKEYEMTRHNAGFLCADFLREAFDFEAFKLDKKMSAELSSGMIDSEKVILVKPETFVNESGTAVQSLVHFYKLSPSDIAVLHDDLDIAPGTLRITDSSRAAGHNGVQDIIDKLGTQDFFRIRLGIGHPTEVLGACMPSHDYVLQKFSSEELAKLPELFSKAKDETLAWLSKK